MIRPRLFAGVLLFLAVPLSLAGVDGAGVAGAAGPSVISDQSGWYAPPAFVTANGTPNGECNVNYSLPGSDPATSPWGYSEACQFSATQDPTGPYGWPMFSPSTDLPGVSCAVLGWAACTSGATYVDDSGAVGSAGDVYDSAYSSVAACGATGNLPPGPPGAIAGCHVTLASNLSGSTHHDGFDGLTVHSDPYHFYTGSGLSSDCVWPMVGDNFWHAHDCRVDMSNYEITRGAGEPVEECTLEFASGSATAVGGRYSGSFRNDCWFPIDSAGDQEFKAPGQYVDSCASTAISSASNDGKVVLSGGSHWSLLNLSVQAYSCTESGEDPEAVMPYTYWSGGSIDSGPCAGIELVPGNAHPVNMTEGDPYRYVMSWAPSATAPDWVEIDPGDHVSGSLTVAGLPGTWPDDAQGRASPVASATFDISPDTTGSYTVHAECSAGGAGFSFETPAAAEPGGPGEAGGGSCYAQGCTIDFAACVDNSGLGLSPSSWVPGLVTDMGCVLSWAFIPASVNTSTLSAPFITTFPGVYVDNVTTAANTLLVDLTADVGGDACAAPSFSIPEISLVTHSPVVVTLPAPSDLGCTGTGDATSGDLFGYRAPIRDVETFGVYMLGFYAIWRMMPWVKEDPPLEFGQPYPGGPVGVRERDGSIRLDGDQSL